MSRIMTAQLIVIMRLILRKNKSETIRNMWFIPALIGGVLPFISILDVIAFVPFAIVRVILNVVYYLLFGYWFLEISEGELKHRCGRN